jgi:hypothetical protein
MPDRALVIAWDRPFHEVEDQAIDAFNDFVGMLSRRQQEGRIERFEVVMLAPNREMGGFFLVHGSADQIHALREDDEFRRANIRAQMVVDGIRHLEGLTGEAIAHQLEMHREVSQALPQHA